jgi:hypothetical protein
MQDFMIKTNSKSKVANAISKKLKKKTKEDHTEEENGDVEDI